jgi:hypothetical protein
MARSLPAAGSIVIRWWPRSENRYLAAQLVLDHAQRVRRTPPLRHRRLGQDRPQPFGVTRAARPDPDPPARQHRMDRMGRMCLRHH